MKFVILKLRAFPDESDEAMMSVSLGGYDIICGLSLLVLCSASRGFPPGCPGFFPLLKNQKKLI